MNGYFRFRSAAARLSAVVVLAAILSAAGCDRDGGDTASTGSQPGSAPSGQAQSAGPSKARIGIIGLTCEAPLFVAHEKGFFTEEGVEVELVKSDWKTLSESLSLGKLDATHTLVMYVLKPIEQGADLKLTAGVHKGCLRIQAGTKTEIKSLEELRGKRIGIPGMGSPPHMFASRVLAANGMDPSKDVTWRVFPPPDQGLALDKGEIEAVATSEPIGTMLLKGGKARNVVDQAVDAPYKDEYCCAVVVSGKFATRDPAGAAKVTRAILKGAKWVQTNPTAAATLSVEKKHLASNPELNAQALSKLSYVPSVAGGRDATGLAAEEMKKAKLLSPTTDVAQLSQRAFLPLEGVTDEWVNGLTVETVAGGGPALDITGEQWAALVAKGGARSCCLLAK